ncbi:drebrin-like protein A [Dendronephthya gigantea]|uniref:drebrin-like protein A n=1 Tax=Dendronephthya gigantea TaxID=151771 RepID=UPI0010690F86|nr:drebrin-like protein A [Dendronephthya gigantea]
MSIDLKTNSASLSKAWQDIFDDKCETDWALFGYEKNTNTLKVADTGDGGFEELSDEWNSGKMLYAGLKVIDPNTNLPKYVLINWVGEGVPSSRKGTCANHVRDVERFFKGHHVAINARNDDDVEESVIIEKVKSSSGANYSYHKEKARPVEAPTAVGSVYQKQNVRKDTDMAKRNQFWSQQEIDEAKRQDEEAKSKTQTKDEAERKRKERELREAKTREEQFRERSRSIDEKRKQEREIAKKKEEERKEKDAARAQAYTKEYEEDKARAAAAAGRREEAADMIRAGKAARPQPPAPQARPRPAVPEPEPDNEPEPEHEPEPEPRYSPEPEPEPRYSPEPEPEPRYSPEPEPEPRYSPEPEPEPEPEPDHRYEPEPEPEPEPELEQDNEYDIPESGPVTGDPSAGYQDQQDDENLYDNADAIVEGTGQEESSGDDVRAKALYDYQAADDSEITFDPGDIITEINQIDPGWWQGRAPDGSYGLFPANYVEIID